MEDLIAALWDKTPAKGYTALKELLSISRGSAAVYPYMRDFVEKLESSNSYFRTRALALIAANAKWDGDYIIDENIGAILAHVTDAKPITARKFIQDLPALAKDKPDLRQDILSALYHANTLPYPLSMRPLVDGDIRSKRLVMEQAQARLNELEQQQDAERRQAAENPWLTACAQFKEEQALTEAMVHALIDRVEIDADNHIKISLRYRDEYNALVQLLAAEGKAVSA